MVWSWLPYSVVPSPSAEGLRPGEALRPHTGRGFLPGVLSDIHNPSIWYTKAGGLLQVGGQPGLHSEFQVNLFCSDNVLSQNEEACRRKKRGEVKGREEERGGEREGKGRKEEEEKGK